MSQEEAIKWIAELFQEPPSRITPETPRTAISGWDSLGILTLMAALDETFGILVTDGDTRAMTKAGDIVDLLRKSGKLN